MAMAALRMAPTQQPQHFAFGNTASKLLQLLQGSLGAVGGLETGIHTHSKSGCHLVHTGLGLGSGSELGDVGRSPLDTR